MSHSCRIPAQAARLDATNTNGGHRTIPAVLQPNPTLQPVLAAEPPILGFIQYFMLHIHTRPLLCCQLRLPLAVTAPNGTRRCLIGSPFIMVRTPHHTQFRSGKHCCSALATMHGCWLQAETAQVRLSLAASAVNALVSCTNTRAITGLEEAWDKMVAPPLCIPSLFDNRDCA